MVYVTDTHPFLWYLAEDKRLSANAKKIFDKAEAGNEIIVVPTIVLAESMHILEEKRLLLKFKDIVKKLEIGLNYTSIPLDLKVIKASEDLEKLKELHDKIIVASAKVLDCPLITKDRGIKNSNYVKAVW